MIPGRVLETLKSRQLNNLTKIGIENLGCKPQSIRKKPESVRFNFNDNLEYFVSMYEQRILKTILCSHL